MTRELFWLTLTVILTGLLWIPYILNRCQVRGLSGAMANPSRNDKPHAEWATRLMFAHDNAVENLIIFAPLVLILNADRLFDQMDRARLRRLFLGPRRPSDRLHARPAGVPHAGLHRRLPGAGRAGAGDLRDCLKACLHRKTGLKTPARGRGFVFADDGRSGAAGTCRLPPQVSAKPSISRMFWTAAPEAPLPRLSRRATRTA